VASTPISIPWSVMLSTSASDISAPPSPWGRRNRPPWSAPAFGGYHVEHRREQYSSSDLSPSTESFPATVSELDYDEYFKRSHSLDED
jgi:hypothetical protein